MGVNETISFDNKKKLFFGSAIDHLADPFRTTRWRMLFSTSIFDALGMDLTNHYQFDHQDGEADFALYINEAPQIPKVTLVEKDISYMGFKKLYPAGQTGLNGTMQMGGVCTEDMAPYEALLEWRNMVYNTGELVNANKQDAQWQNNRIAQDSSNHIHLGLGQQANWQNPTAQLLRNQCITMELYDWMYGNCILSVTYINAWPKEVSITNQFRYGSAELGTWSAQFAYDRFTLWIPPGYYAV